MRKHWEPSLRALKWLLRLCAFIILVVTISFFSGLELLLNNFGLMRDNPWLPVLVSAVASLPLGALLTTLTLHYPLRPVNKLLSGMKRLAAGHFEERLHLGRAAYLNEIADTFNTLASELENTEMLRSDFVNNFSHEFKTPIVSVHGFARLLQREDLTEQQRKEYVDIIVDETTRLSSMATNVLNLTRLENQTILSNVQEFNLSEQLRRCILLLEKKWNARGLSIEADFPEHLLSGDEELLKQVWLNLLDNAIKFSPFQSEVAVTLNRTPQAITVSIHNHGPEIPAHARRRLFDKFWQGDASHATEGTGIGLSLVKRIVELHKGSIDVTSSPEVTVFSVTLPLA